MKELIRKLKKEAGESLAEVLVALLIVVTSVLLLVGVIGSAVRLVEKSRSSIQEHYKLHNEIAGKAAETEEGTLRLSFVIDDETVSETISVTLYMNESEVAAYAYEP